MPERNPKRAADRPFPPVPAELLVRLEELFPRTIPTHLVEPQQFAVLVGQQQVIGKLRQEFRKQIGNNNLHETKV